MEQNKINLSDLMTAAQALKIIEMLEDLTKRLENLENEVKNHKAEKHI